MARAPSPANAASAASKAAGEGARATRLEQKLVGDFSSIGVAELCSAVQVGHLPLRGR